MPLLLNTSYSKDKFLSIKPSRRKKTWLVIIAGILVIALGWWAWGQFAPRPLGDRLDYLGKTDSGNWLGFDSFPSSTYYYETNMNADESVKYFTNATVVDEPGTSPSTSFVLKAPSGETFRVTSYTKNVFEEKYTNLPKPQYNYVLSIDDSKYNAAKDSL